MRYRQIFFNRSSEIITVTFFCLALLSRSYAFDNPLTREIQPRNFLNQYKISLYNISGNPAFFGVSYPENSDYYQTKALSANNDFRRLYDPRKQEDYELSINSIKHLSESSTLATGIQFNRTILRDVYRSLEKNIYDEYFSYLDTTTGTNTYDGPQVRFLYDYAMAKRLHFGVEINYGVEQSLKDVYTKCETIARNTELRAGLGYISLNRKTSVGISGALYDAQRKYEAVKDLQDAFVRTLYGYHIFMDETPKSTNRKNDDREGWGMAFQLAQRDFFLPGLNVTLTGEYNGRSDNVTAGAVSTPTTRGYWVRNVYRGLLSLNYSPIKSKNSLSLLYEYRLTDDWAKSGDYDVIILDNSEKLNEITIHWQSKFLSCFILNAGASMATNSCNYQEYTQSFKYNQTDINYSAFADLNLAINQIFSVYLLGSLTYNDLYFYWNADNAIRYFTEVGMERLTVFGSVGAAFVVSQTTFNRTDLVDSSIGLKILYKK